MSEGSPEARERSEPIFVFLLDPKCTWEACKVNQDNAWKSSCQQYQHLNQISAASCCLASSCSTSRLCSRWTEWKYQLRCSCICHICTTPWKELSVHCLCCHQSDASWKDSASLEWPGGRSLILTLRPLCWEQWKHRLANLCSPYWPSLSVLVVDQELVWVEVSLWRQ